LKLPIAYIDIRFSAHATEDPGKVQKAAHNLFPQDRLEKVIFKKGILKGHYGNPITLFEARIKDEEMIKAFVEKLSSSLSELDKIAISEISSLSADKNNLYLRLDKQAALEDQFKLCTADPIHVRIHFKKKGVAEICREIGLAA
jgi:RNA binding exosome subunit